MATRPPELSMDAKWEAAIDLTLRRLVYGSLAGGAAGLLLFRACTPRAYFDTLLSSLSRPPVLLSPCTSRLHLTTNLVDCSSLNVGGAGSRSASLAFGAGAALGSAYTGEYSFTPIFFISKTTPPAKSFFTHVPLHCRSAFAPADRVHVPFTMQIARGSSRASACPSFPRGSIDVETRWFWFSSFAICIQCMRSYDRCGLITVKYSHMLAVRKSRFRREISVFHLAPARFELGFRTE